MTQRTTDLSPETIESMRQGCYSDAQVNALIEQRDLNTRRELVSSERSDSVACECCGRSREEGVGWVVGQEGEDYCRDCYESLVAEARRLAQALPLKIALCPQCAAEFYYPLRDGEGAKCPTPGCNMEMVVYVRSRLPEGYRS